MKLITQNKKYKFKDTGLCTFLISGKIKTVTVLLMKTNLNRLISYEA